MSANTRRVLPGRFQIEVVGDEGLRLTALELPQVVIVARTAGRHSAGEPVSSACGGVAIEWSDGGATLSLELPGGSQVVRAGSVIVHEPQERLFDSLALPKFDAKGRRFWRRVFTLVRIPGGRYLLGALARRARDRT
jgi:hypothetical protein